MQIQSVSESRGLAYELLWSTRAKQEPIMSDTTYEHRFENTARFKVLVVDASRRGKSCGITSQQLRQAAEKVARLRDKQKGFSRH